MSRLGPTRAVVIVTIRLGAATRRRIAVRGAFWDAGCLQVVVGDRVRLRVRVTFRVRIRVRMGWGDDFDTAIATGRAILLGVVVSVAAGCLQVVARDWVRLRVKVRARVRITVKVRVGMG